MSSPADIKEACLNRYILRTVMADVRYALSIKQPWAALLAHGLKTIEVRRWPTARRGRILIHAARIPDERPEAWALVPRELTESANLLGGIIGAGELTECRAYLTLTDFSADCPNHLNDASWFELPVLYGFVFDSLHELPFRKYPGWMRFFPIDQALPVRKSKSGPKKS